MGCQHARLCATVAPLRRLKIFFDGGCRPNPGRIEVAVVAGGVATFVDDLGHGSSEDAEWLALIEALRLARSLGAPDFDLIGDNLHVVTVANGRARCRTPASAGHFACFNALAGAAPPTRIRWVQRSQNLAGIALARRRGG